MLHMETHFHYWVQIMQKTTLLRHIFKEERENCAQVGKFTAGTKLLQLITAPNSVT